MLIITKELKSIQWKDYSSSKLLVTLDLIHDVGEVHELCITIGMFSPHYDHTRGVVCQNINALFKMPLN